LLVRGNGSSKGLARDLLVGIVESDHILPLSNEDALRVGEGPALSANAGASRPFRATYLPLRRFACTRQPGSRSRIPRWSHRFVM
jgi:hypothetical protein